MQKNKLFFFLLFLSSFLTAQERNDKPFHIRMGFAPVVSFYKNNPNHTSGTKPRSAYDFYVKGEFKVHKQIGLLFGIEYFTHGLTFNSYYFGKNGNFLYDKNFNYLYSLRIQELNLPIQIRLIPRSEFKKHFSPYVCFGYSFRYLAAVDLEADSKTDGTAVFADQVSLDFEHPYIYKNGSSFLTFTPGFQKNIVNTHHALFAELAFKYALTRFYINEPFMASSIYVRHFHFAFTIGYKF